SAYATARSGRTVSEVHHPGRRRRGPVDPAFDGDNGASHSFAASQPDLGLLNALITDVAERVAAAVVARLGTETSDPVPEWLDSRLAAEYLGVHRDTLRKLAGGGGVPAAQG